MSQSNQYYFNWVSTGSLGSILLWSQSEKSVKIETNSNGNFKYKLTSGSLPPGLELHDTGLIVGVATSSTTTLSTKFVTSSSIINSLSQTSTVLSINSTLNSVFNLSLIAVSDLVTASSPGIPLNTYITSITTNSFILSTSTTATLNTGTVISFTRSTASINTYTFAVSVNKLGSDPITTATFSLSVANKKNTIFAELYVKPFMTAAHRAQWQNFINNTKIFNRDSLYRPFDQNFGIQTDLKCVLHYDYQLFSTRDLSLIFAKNFYRRRFTLSQPKIRYAKINGGTVYEVIYLDILDYNTVNNISISKKINISGADYYPSTFDNMRQQLEDNGETNQEIRPLHFSTLQENELRVDSYFPCVILCFALPSQGKSILDKIKAEKINFNEFDFEINKVFIKNHYTGITQAININQNPGIS